MVTSTALEIKTAKEHTVAAVKFSASNFTNQLIVISSATGVLQKYYANFAKFFAEKGFIVYTFDYYGIGQSSATTSALKKNTCNLKSWGQNDQAAVVAFAKTAHPNASLTLITHSIGGQLVGFNPNYKLIDKVIMVASQTGYWQSFHGFNKLKMWCFWFVLIPLLTPLFGYFPAKKFGLFENLPKHMAYEWASWGRKKNYMMHFHTPNDYFFEALHIPFLVLSFSNDAYAPKNTVDWLAKQYKNATINRVHHTPKEGEKQPKHFGFFKARFKNLFWHQTLSYILNSTYNG